MVFIYTSVWIHHLRSGNPCLVRLIEGNVAAVHDFMIGEMACGNLKKRQEILSLLSFLPRCLHASHQEMLFFIDRKRIMGRGLGDDRRLQSLDRGQKAGRYCRGVGMCLYPDLSSIDSFLLRVTYKKGGMLKILGLNFQTRSNENERKFFGIPYTVFLQLLFS